MDEPTYPIWAKSPVENADTGISLADHISDAVKVLEALKNKGKISGEKLFEISKLSILLHDLGKCLPYFQLKTLGNKMYRPFEISTNVPHSLLSALLINQNELRNKISEIIKGGDSEIDAFLHYVMSAIAYHHWRENFSDITENHTNTFDHLYDLVNGNEWKMISQNLEISLKQIKEFPKELFGLNEKWLTGLKNGLSFSSYVTPPYLLYRLPDRIHRNFGIYSNVNQILISGFTQIADHFASFIESENDFNHEEVELQSLNYPEIQEGVIKNIQEKIPGFKEDDLWQKNIVKDKLGKNTILLAPTGIGKTEFALLWASGEKFFYTLPIRAAVNQIHKRIANIFGESKTGLLHSDADLILLENNSDTEQIRTYELSRSLSFPAIVSTGDQFFPYSLRPPGYEKIFARFSYSRLIIDEVQAYDPKAAAIVVKYIEDIVSMGGKFLLMTATLPDFIKDAIKKRVDIDEPLNLLDTEGFEQLGKFAKHKIAVRFEKDKEKCTFSKELIGEIITKAETGSRVLVVLNTVAQAQSVYQKILDISKNTKIKPENIRLFHSRFRQADRANIENDLLKFFGNPKPEAEKEPKILVATQVVEASLDLDADYLFTEIAPWDALIQRMGRVLRAYRQTSSNYIQMRYHKDNDEIPDNIFVIIFDEIFESGKGKYVYHNDLIQATARFFESVPFSDITDELLIKWRDKNPKVQFKELSKFKGSLLSERDKNQIISNFFKSLPKESKYLSTFYEMLNLLDAGYMSDRKSDAQRIFREISDAQVVSKTDKDNIMNSIIENISSFKGKRSYTNFKKMILSEFVISVQFNKVKNYLTTEYALYINIEDELKKSGVDALMLKRLENWLSNIFIVELDYDKNSGLTGILENKPFEFI